MSSGIKRINELTIGQRTWNGKNGQCFLVNALVVAISAVALFLSTGPGCYGGNDLTVKYLSTVHKKKKYKATGFEDWKYCHQTPAIHHMMPTELEELVEFLHHGNTQIRQIAAENLVPYSKNFPSIFKSAQCTPIKDLKLLIRDYPIIAKNALTILINISSDQEVLKLLVEDDTFLETVLSLMTNPKEPNGNELAMLLANMAKSDSIIRLTTLKQKPVSDLTSSDSTLDQLIELFNKGANEGYNSAANFDYLGYVFGDLVKISTFPTYLTTSITSSLPPLCSLAPFTTHPSLPRRLSLSLLLRNLTLTHSQPLLLLKEPISLLPQLLLPLLGPDPPFTESETDQLLPELQYLGSEQVRETDLEVMKGLLEALYLLVVRGDRQSEEEGQGKQGKRLVKEAGTYLIARELHKDVEDEGVREGCERLVDVLVALEDADDEKGKIGEEQKVQEVDEGEEENKLVEIF